jgi:nucleoside 2-deoxyribosyltransferase
MKCFVASAFGYRDVDLIFDKCVRPVLKELGITPLRVDRQEHNDDIDDKIIELMDESDFCIADLTYARPSAYFEAGRMSASKPVIYIVRSDHFRQRDNDPLGNEAVHFDLKMKNIIGWIAPSDQFCSRLRTRILKVVKPIIAAKEKQSAREQNRSLFSRMSHWAQIKALQNSAAQVFKRCNFAEQDEGEWHVGEIRRWSCRREEFRVTAAFVARMRFSVTDIRALRNQFGIETGDDVPAISHAYVVASPARLRRSVFRGRFPTYEELPDGSLFFDVLVKNTGKFERRYVFFIDDITSPSELEEVLHQKLRQLVHAW